MSQTEVIWVLFTTLQAMIFGFVGYWTRRVQGLERAMADWIEARTKLMVGYEGRIARLEAQFEAILRVLQEIREDVRDGRQEE